MTLTNPSPPLAPGETSSSTIYKARIIGDYILENLATHKATRTDRPVPPLMVAMHGPQGCGKTTLTEEIQKYLAASPVNARSAVLSLDDLYHTHQALLDLSARHPENRLLAGRGLPGTHDLDLARQTIDAILTCNQGATPRIQLPVFDKSAFGGQGDRSSKTVPIDTPLDVFILEGWSMGFQPLHRDDLIQLYNHTRFTHAHDSSGAPAFLSHPLEHLLQVNDHLEQASTVLYPAFSLLVQIRPESYAHVYEWRVEQEHQLIEARGEGMSDRQVEEFVRRYMPGYELWAGAHGRDGWSGKSLVLWYGRGREVVAVDRV